MQLYILDKDPIKSANMIPDKYKFKMLIELGQLISTLTKNGIYKPVRQGQELVYWIDKNANYVDKYYYTLLKWSEENINMKEKTKNDLYEIWYSLEQNYIENLTYAYFRYAKEYVCNIPSKTLLPIDECITEYRKYIQWKMNNTKSYKTKELIA